MGAPFLTFCLSASDISGKPVSPLMMIGPPFFICNCSSESTSESSLSDIVVARQAGEAQGKHAAGVGSEAEELLGTVLLPKASYLLSIRAYSLN